MVKILYTAKFWETYKELIKEGNVTENQIEQNVRWFCNNPEDTRIFNHELKKNLLGKSSFSINNNIRIVYRWLGKNIVQFLKIGGHKEVYS